MAEPFDDEAFRHLHRTHRRNAAHIVPPEVHEHQMLRPFLRIGQQFGFQRLILLMRGTAPPRAGQRPDRHDTVAQPHQNLRRGSDDGEPAEIQEEQERCRIDPPQRAIQRERRQRERYREPLADHDLKRVAGRDVFLAAGHRVDESRFGKIRRRCRRVGQHDRRRLCRHRSVHSGLGLRQTRLRPRPGVVGGQFRLRVDRSNQRKLVVHVVENGEQRRANHDTLGHAQRVLVLLRQLLHQPDHVVAEVADQPARHRWQARWHVQADFLDQRAQTVQCRPCVRQEGMRCGQRLTIDGRLPVHAFPNQVRRHPDDRIAAALGPALDAFQQEGIRLAVCQLQEGGNRGIQVRHALAPHQGATPVLVSGAEGGKAGRYGHVHRTLYWFRGCTIWSKFV